MMFVIDECSSLFPMVLCCCFFFGGNNFPFLVG